MDDMIKIYVYKNVLDRVKKFNCEVLLKEAVEKVLSKPYYWVVYNRWYIFHLSEAEPINVYVSHEISSAWGTLSEKERTALLKLINDEIEVLIKDLELRVKPCVLTVKGGEA